MILLLYCTSSASTGTYSWTSSKGTMDSPGLTPNWVPTGGSNHTTLAITAKPDTEKGSMVEYPTYVDSMQVSTMVEGPLDPSKIIISTNRQTILDDPGSASIPYSSSDWNSDYWNSESTTIRAKIMALDSKGHAISGQTINVKIYDSSNSLISGSSENVVTDSNGLVSYDYNLNGYEDTDIGTFNIVATVLSNGISASTSFNYDFWGCGDCHGNKHRRDYRPFTAFNAVSPYLGTYAIHGYTTYEHGRSITNYLISNNDCTSCHRNYGPNAQEPIQDMRHNNQYSLASDAGNQTTYGMHEDKKYCQDCHIIGCKDNPIGPDFAIKECDNAECHISKNDKVKIDYAFINGTPGSGGKYIYSQSLTAHQGTPTIPCGICHEAMHNITKPDTSAGTSNNYTEDTQCIKCHTNQGKHSNDNPVYCTACHSQDIHSIGVLNKNASTQPVFVSVGSPDAMKTSDCVECHTEGPEATYFASMTEYGYTKNYSTVVPAHADAECTACHDDNNFHNISSSHEVAYMDNSDCLLCHETIIGSGHHPNESIDCLSCHFTVVDISNCTSSTCHGQDSDFQLPETGHHDADTLNKYSCTYCHGAALEVDTSDCRSSTCHESISGSKHHLIDHINCIDCHGPSLEVVNASNCAECHSDVIYSSGHHIPDGSGELDCLSCHPPWQKDKYNCIFCHGTMHQNCTECHSYESNE